MFCKAVTLCCLLWLIAGAVVYAEDVNHEALFIGLDYINNIPCGQFTCNRTTQECVDGMSCECRPEFERNPDDDHCQLCPSEGHFCSSCCYGGAVCFAGRCQHCWKDQNGDCISQDSLFFLTAAQVALATAMVIGVSALATLLYKTFRARSRHNNQQMLESELHRSSLSRVSLTSVQIRVLRRLRDRPPKYETRHNYEFHQRERTERTDADHQRHNTTPVSEPSRLTVSIGDPPPAYDGDVTSLADFPPPYSADLPHPEARIAIIGEQSLGELATSNRTAVVTETNGESGVDNRTFENSEENDTKADERVDLNLVNNSGHKTIHI